MLVLEGNVVDTGRSLEVPVGDALLGRMLNVFRDVTDGGPPLEQVEWRSIHGLPVPLARRGVRSEIFETGIEVVDDLLCPLEATLDGGCERILDDELADREESAFYMVGGIDEVRGKAKREVKREPGAEARPT